MRKETVENPYLSEEVEETEIVLMFDDLIINAAVKAENFLTHPPYFIRKLNLTDFIN